MDTQMTATKRGREGEQHGNSTPYKHGHKLGGAVLRKQGMCARSQCTQWRTHKCSLIALWMEGRTSLHRIYAAHSVLSVTVSPGAKHKRTHTNTHIQNREQSIVCIRNSQHSCCVDVLVCHIHICYMLFVVFAIV